MLIVAGSFIAEPGERDAFLTAVQPMVSATLEEAGCQDYTFSPDPNDDNRIMLFELWDDQAALDGHFASAHMAEWRAVSATLKVASANVEKYIISEVGTLP